jgi:hypothetical protein
MFMPSVRKVLKRMNEGLVGSPESLLASKRKLFGAKPQENEAELDSRSEEILGVREGKEYSKAQRVGSAFAAPFINTLFSAGQLVKALVFTVRGVGKGISGRLTKDEEIREDRLEISRNSFKKAGVALADAGVELVKGVSRLAVGTVVLGTFIGGTTVGAAGGYVAGVLNAVSKNSLVQHPAVLNSQGRNINKSRDFSPFGFIKGAFRGVFYEGPKAAFNTVKASLEGAGENFTEESTATGVIGKTLKNVNEKILSREPEVSRGAENQLKVLKGGFLANLKCFWFGTKPWKEQLIEQEALADQLLVDRGAVDLAAEEQVALDEPVSRGRQPGSLNVELEKGQSVSRSSESSESSESESSVEESSIQEKRDVDLKSLAIESKRGDIAFVQALLTANRSSPTVSGRVL